MVSLKDPNIAWQFLTEPQLQLAVEDMAEHWYIRDYKVRVKDYGVLWDKPSMLTRLRGAIGNATMSGASTQSLANNSCPWNPPCLNDLFYGPKPNSGIRGQNYPNPYILMSDRIGQDLILTLRVFGFANEWLPVIRSNFLAAVRQNIPWSIIGKDAFLPKETEISYSNEVISVQVPKVIPSTVLLRFTTPFDCKNYDPLNKPLSLCRSIRERFQMMARWHSVDIDMGVEGLEDDAQKFEFLFEYSKSIAIKRKSKRYGGKPFDLPGRIFDLEIHGDLKRYWPIFCAVTHMNVGRATSFGFGRFDVCL